MALHEQMKSAKIVEEIFSYLMHKGYKHVDLHYHMKDNETQFLIELPAGNKEFVKDFKDDFICCREEGLEEYGWELTGDIDCVCSLNTLSMLIDSYDITEGSNKIVIVLHRKF